ncbi:MAG: type I-U CRISPR-associated protein Cas5/Cas6 [Chthoniobacterales bacterium]|nr:type I-U CRISPR-associated protein Cas5/Cas6 [Chthoniobacterales bacterium]
MIAIRFHFVTGRWHATAWGSHVNEGVPDWPPAPWRICRALIATWFHKHRTVFEEPRIRELIETLAAAAPSYALPSATAAHTRHYMPVIAGRNESKTKIFDTFVHVAPGESLDVLWPVEVDAAQRELMATLLASMNYFGRAESLVEAALLPANAALPKVNARPVVNGERVQSEEEPIRLLAPATPEEHAAWFAKQAMPTSKAKGKKKTNTASLPSSIFDALLADTGDLKAAGWSQPPGSRWIDYARPAEPFRIAPQRKPVLDERRPTVARFAVVSDVPPRITEALSLGERFHRALVSRCATPVFTGCNAAGEPLADGHQHAFYFSECDPHHGMVKFFTLYARMGFDVDARRALEKLRQTWGYDGHKLQLILLGTGEREDFAGESPDAGHSLPLGTSREWISLTPFVPTRHLKTRRNGEPKLDANGIPIGSPEHDLRRLLPESGFPEPTEVAPVPHLQLENRSIHWLEFQRTRKTGNGSKAGERGYGFRIAFSEAVRGPIAVGYGAHFGLGLFVPAVA